MSPDRLFDHAPHLRGIDANAGVEISLGPSRFVVRAKYLEPEPDRSPNWQTEQPPGAFDLPSLPSRLVEDMARLLRVVWRRSERCATWLLYLHLAERSWHPFLAPQFAMPDATRLNAAFPGVDVPSHRVRLAGSFRATTLAVPSELAAECPPHDGVHVAWHPGHWLHVSVVIIAAGQAYHVPVEEVVEDPPEDQWPALHGRLWLSDEM